MLLCLVESNDLNNNTSKKEEKVSSSFSLSSSDAFLFHSPYCKLVQKSFARLLWNDYLESEGEGVVRMNGEGRNGNGDCEKVFGKVVSEELSALDKYK